MKLLRQGRNLGRGNLQGGRGVARAQHVSESLDFHLRRGQGVTGFAGLFLRVFGGALLVCNDDGCRNIMGAVTAEGGGRGGGDGDGGGGSGSGDPSRQSNGELL